MEKNNFSGKFIVFEGIDGSGKSTQTKLLAKHLRERGYDAVLIDFPQYGKKSAGLVEEYLNGKYGTAEQVGPYRASVFYASDRYDASFQLKKWLKQDKIVIADRYLASNIGHQGGKLKNSGEWKKYVEWLYDLEYNIFGIPKPDINIILKTDPTFSLKLVRKITDRKKKDKRKIYLGRKKNDIHDKNIRHLIDAQKSYIKAAKEFPQEFKVVECLEKGKLLPPQTIHQKVIKIIKKIL